MNKKLKFQVNSKVMIASLIASFTVSAYMVFVSQWSINLAISMFLIDTGITYFFWSIIDFLLFGQSEPKEKQETSDDDNGKQKGKWAKIKSIVPIAGGLYYTSETFVKDETEPSTEENEEIS